MDSWVNYSLLDKSKVKKPFISAWCQRCRKNENAMSLGPFQPDCRTDFFCHFVHIFRFVF